MGGRGRGARALAHRRAPARPRWRCAALAQHLRPLGLRGVAGGRSPQYRGDPALRPPQRPLHLRPRRPRRRGGARAGAGDRRGRDAGARGPGRRPDRHLSAGRPRRGRHPRRHRRPPLRRPRPASTRRPRPRGSHRGDHPRGPAWVPRPAGAGGEPARPQRDDGAARRLGALAVARGRRGRLRRFAGRAPATVGARARLPRRGRWPRRRGTRPRRQPQHLLPPPRRGFGAAHALSRRRPAQKSRISASSASTRRPRRSFREIPTPAAMPSCWTEPACRRSCPGAEAGRRPRAAPPPARRPTTRGTRRHRCCC